MRFYGNKRLNDIIYSNSRNARDPPGYISGDETITRLYKRKATDIRMRTSKKTKVVSSTKTFVVQTRGTLRGRKEIPREEDIPL